MNGVTPRLLLLLTQHIDETLFVLFVSQENVFLYSVFTRSQCTATALVDRLFTERASSLTEGP